MYFFPRNLNQTHSYPHCKKSHSTYTYYMNFKLIFSTFLALILLALISFLLYQKFSVTTIEYSGLGALDNNQLEVKKDIIVKSESLDSDVIEFVQRKITGGGINPGWVISLLETQPNIFTGRVIVDDGVYQHPVTLKEQVTNVFVGEMKSKDKKSEIFTLNKEDKNCSDEENNLYEYTLTGTYGGTSFSGCGGTVLVISPDSE